MNPKSRKRAPKSFRNGVKTFINVFNTNKHGVHLKYMHTSKTFRKADKYIFNVIHDNNRIGMICLYGFPDKCEVMAYNVKIESIYNYFYLYKKGMPKFRYLGGFLRSRILKAQGIIIAKEIMES